MSLEPAPIIAPGEPVSSGAPKALMWLAIAVAVVAASFSVDPVRGSESGAAARRGPHRRQHLLGGRGVRALLDHDTAGAHPPRHRDQRNARRHRAEGREAGVRVSDIKLL